MDERREEIRKALDSVMEARAAVAAVITPLLRMTLDEELGRAQHRLEKARELFEPRYEEQRARDLVERARQRNREVSPQGTREKIGRPLERARDILHGLEFFDERKEAEGRR